MEQFVEFVSNNALLSGLFALVLVAWLIYEVSRIARKWREVSTLEAVRLINKDDTLVLDVSNSADHAKGHILGAQHMPPSVIESGNKQLLKHKEKPVLVYCKNGQVSPQMANKLVQLGFTDVAVLSGGLAQWASDQQPVSRQKAGAKGKGKGKGSGGKGGGKKKDKRSGQARLESGESPTEAVEGELVEPADESSADDTGVDDHSEPDSEDRNQPSGERSRGPAN